MALGDEALEGDRLVDLRLTDGLGDDEREETGGEADSAAGGMMPTCSMSSPPGLRVPLGVP